MIRTAALDDVDLTRDRALVELAQSGDLTAFAQLYTRYFQRLVRFATKRVGDVHEAEEIAQEAFARAYRALPDFAGERRFYPWMTVIASRLCVDTIRRRGRVEVGEIIDTGFDEPGFDRLDFDGDVQKLNAAMSRLNERHREILELRERQGWSYQHIADHLEVSLGTVEALLWRARKALRREFTALGSALLLLPGIRRLAARTHEPQPVAYAALGSIGTVVALSLSSLAGASPAVAAPATLSAINAAAISTPIALTAAASGSPAATTSAATRIPSVSHVRGSSTVTPNAAPKLVRLQSGDDGRMEASSQPVTISIGEHGPFVGLAPGVVPAPRVSVQVGK